MKAIGQREELTLHRVDCVYQVVGLAQDRRGPGVLVRSWIIENKLFEVKERHSRLTAETYWNGLEKAWWDTYLLYIREKIWVIVELKLCFYSAVSTLFTRRGTRKATGSAWGSNKSRPISWRLSCMLYFYECKWATCCEERLTWGKPEMILRKLRGSWINVPRSLWDKGMVQTASEFGVWFKYTWPR